MRPHFVCAEGVAVRDLEVLHRAPLAVKLALQRNKGGRGATNPKKLTPSNRRMFWETKETISTIFSEMFTRKRPISANL